MVKNDGRFRCALLKYAHSDPLSLMLGNLCTQVRSSPASNLHNVLDGHVDVAMVSVLSYFDNRDTLKILHGPTIHSLYTTGSTLLISNGAPMERTMRIAKTPETRTTEAYLSIILKSMGIEFTFTDAGFPDADSLLEDSSHALIMGDEALKVYGSRHRILLDVGYELQKLFHISPLYAVTVARSDLEADVSFLTQGAISTRERNLRKTCAEGSSRRLGVPYHILRWYYDLIKYSFDSRVMKSLEFIESRLQEDN